MRHWWILIGLASSAPAAAAADPFAEPAKVCEALAAAGLKPTAWKRVTVQPFNWQCVVFPDFIGPAGAKGLASTIGAHVAGPTEGRAEEIVVYAHLNDPASRAEALDRLRKAADALFGLAGAPIPKPIGEALKTGKAASAKAPFGRVALTIDRGGGIESFKLRMTPAAAAGR